MTTRPGEENLTTAFGDIHYHYLPPEIKPQHHRFDRRSYVYLFKDVDNARCRLEIVNNPGTEYQDAFTGYFDQTHLHYSTWNHQCRVSVTIPESLDLNEWHLPTYDLRNENIYNYKLQSLDIYFSTHQDAVIFVDHVNCAFARASGDERASLQQLAVMSPLVQKLERAAGADNQYEYGSSDMPATSRPERTTAAFLDASANVLPPPVPKIEYQPVAYNPAAPTAPETIRHRDKTPPPDDDPVNSLAVAVAQDLHATSPNSSSLPSTHLGAYAVMGLGFANKQERGIQRTGATAAPSGPAYFFGARPGSITGEIPAKSSPAGPASTAITAPQQPVPQPTPPGTGSGAAPPPPGAFGQQYQSCQVSQDYSIHKQVYQPAESEMQQEYQSKKESRGKFEEHAGRLERGVSGILKKFEKKFG
ncbi:RNA recognition motif-containing protein [Ophiocordyceps camponoti-floridani]|uniref:RNA recognition motif-containing protein n=1 Tax=Ophiocordyceps camponoti-floridani TaxID=2030778 RepID=A0A8H4Q7V8_9HYPO|nr:RNA recognition motif-containing protein [Ophiocordyceps camponoti-floridani]